jgi:hypothetical protein
VTYETELRQITRRLKESSGRRIARRNALRDLDSLLKRIRRELRDTYPSIGKDGKEIVVTVLPRGERKCPTDGTYVPTPGAFAKHVVTKHDGKCWCGFTPSWWIKNAAGERTRHQFIKGVAVSPKALMLAANSLRGHFTRVKDQLTSHLVYGSIKQLSAEDNGPRTH